MANIKIGKRDNWFTVLLFQLCVITNNVFGMDERLFIISKAVTLAFFGVVALRILYRGKVRYNQILLLPILFSIYCAATILWAYNPGRAQSQMITQAQLFMLLVFTFWAMNDGVTVMDYLKAVYVSGFGMMLYMLVKEGGPVQYFSDMIAGERMGGAYANPYGMVYGNAALAAAYYMMLMGKKKHIFCIGLFSLFALSTASRKAMLIIVIGVIAIAMLHYGWRRIYWTVLAVAAVFVAAYFVLKLPYFGQIGDRILNLISGEQDASDIERNQMVQLGIELFKERPIHGYGIGNYAVLCFRDTYSHHNYIELMVSGGVIALVMYYLMLLVPAIGLVQSKRKGMKMDPMHVMLITWLAVELIFGVAMVQLYNKNSWLLIGVVMAEAARASAQKMGLQENGNETA